MKPTLELLRSIGSPYAKTTQLSIIHLHERNLYEYSKKNRISLLYLEALNKNHNLQTLELIYRKEQAQYLKTLNAIARASIVLAEKDIDYAIFKTIRPYKSTTVDIDIIVFGDKRCQTDSLKAMLRAGYELVTCGPMSVTLWDKEASIAIDLYEQVAVSSITYVDKERLSAHVASMKLPNKKRIKALRPEADLACLIAHSVIKEQMYTLSEYYTFIHYLKQIDINNFIHLVKQNNIKSAVRTHANLTALLHKAAHDTTPNELQRILNNLGQEKFETARLIRNNFVTPHKYHPITITKSLFEITKGIETRKSMAIQLSKMLNANFTMDFFRKFINHIFRKTY